MELDEVQHHPHFRSHFPPNPHDDRHFEELGELRVELDGVQHQHRDEEEDEELQGSCYTVVDERLHAPARGKVGGRVQGVRTSGRRRCRVQGRAMHVCSRGGEVLTVYIYG